MPFEKPLPATRYKEKEKADIAEGLKSRERNVASLRLPVLKLLGVGFY